MPLTLTPSHSAVFRCVPARATGSAAAGRNESSGHAMSQRWAKEQLNKDQLAPAACWRYNRLGEMWETSRQRHVAVAIMDTMPLSCCTLEKDESYSKPKWLIGRIQMLRFSESFCTGEQANKQMTILDIQIQIPCYENNMKVFRR